MTELPAPIASGREAEIYPWGEGKVLKLFFEHTAPDQVEREASCTRIVHATGFSVPAIYEQLEINGRKGFVMDRLSGRSLLDELKSHPWQARRIGAQMGRLHADMHTRSGDGMPDQRGYLQWCIRNESSLTEAEREKILAHLATLPDGNTLCHGDLHVDNIILSEHGPVIIDWAHPVHGNPLGDAARSVLMLTVGDPPNASPFLLFMARTLRGAARAGYLQAYCTQRGISPREIEPWILPYAAARLRENIPGEKPLLLAMIRKRLKEM